MGLITNFFKTIAFNVVGLAVLALFGLLLLQCWGLILNMDVVKDFLALDLSDSLKD